MKNKRFEIESKIIKHIYEDNQNTVHFDYHVNIDDGSITLDLFTFNKRNNSVFLLNQTDGRNSVEALDKMYFYLRDLKRDKAPYTVTWKKIGDGGEHKSYFWEKCKGDVHDKFFYNKFEDDYEFKIELRPLS